MTPTTRVATLLGCAALLVMTDGCKRDAMPPSAGSKVAQKVGRGKVSGQQYSHDYFKLSMTFPDGWYIASDEEKSELMDRGGEFAAGGDENKRALLESRRAQTLNLVSAFQLPPGTPTPAFNPNIIVVAESVKGLPGIKSGQEYLEHLKMNLPTTRMKPQVGEIEGGVKLGKHAAHRLSATAHVGDRTVRQQYYETRVGDYVMTFILTHGDDADLAKLTPILEKMKFDGP